MTQQISEQGTPETGSLDGRAARLLVNWRAGDTTARDELIALLYPQLAHLAAARLRRESNSSLSSGDLIHEALARLLAIGDFDVSTRAHFIALAARLMRHVLVDAGRQKSADKRRHIKVELTTHVDGEQRFDLIALETALIRLKAVDPDLVDLVDMRYFGGMSLGEVAAVTGLSESTVKRRWHAARTWLADALAHPLDDL